MTKIVRNGDTAGRPTIAETGIRVVAVATAYDSSGYDPDEIAQLYPELSLADVHAALTVHQGESE